MGDSSGGIAGRKLFPSPIAAFAALSARSSASISISSDIGEIDRYIRDGDDTNTTLAIDRRMRSLANMGLTKPEKLTTVGLWAYQGVPLAGAHRPG